MKTNTHKTLKANILALSIIAFFLLWSLPLVIPTPTGPSSINVTANETATLTNGVVVNISGGRIATLNITANVQNPHWKAFVGEVNGQFSLKDSGGSTIYDWSSISVTGEVYATRTSGSVTWASITCANVTHINNEDTVLVHTGNNDRINLTFNGSNTATYIVAGTTLGVGTCRSLNTYINNASQGTDFEEILTHDGTNLVYVTQIENNVQGFDSNTYDFQMIVAENASSAWTSATPYYVYVEIG